LLGFEDYGKLPHTLKQEVRRIKSGLPKEGRKKGALGRSAV